jgi:hypothetical protein
MSVLELQFFEVVFNLKRRHFVFILRQQNKPNHNRFVSNCMNFQLYFLEKPKVVIGLHTTQVGNEAMQFHSS